MSSSEARTVQMPPLVLVGLVVICGSVGFGAGFAIPPFVAWATSFLPGLPGPLELAASLPTVWLVPIMTALGLVVGAWLATEAKQEALSVTVDSKSLLVAAKKKEKYIVRDDVAAVFTDPKDFVVLDHDDRQLYRYSASDVSTTQLAEAMNEYGFPWIGTQDPHESKFRRWVDGHPDVEAEINGLLRRRGERIGSDKTGEVDELTGQLQALGVVVRDKNKQQQYRKLGQ